MGQFGDAAYEPSADELIDVLKNLENLAALNPGLYRQIVTQIKGKFVSQYSYDICCQLLHLNAIQKNICFLYEPSKQLSCFSLIPLRKKNISNI